MPEHAVKAYAALDGTVFQGRMFHLIASKSKPTDEDAEGIEYAISTNYSEVLNIFAEINGKFLLNRW